MPRLKPKSRFRAGEGVGTELIEYLEKLLEDADYNKVMPYAEKMLLNRNSSAKDLLVINHALLIARAKLGEYQGALVSGELVLRLSQDLLEWDYYGSGCFYLGAVYMRVRQPTRAIEMCYNYLARVNSYGKAREQHHLVLFNLGMFYSAEGDHAQAMDTLKKAVAVGEDLKEDRDTHGIRHGLIHVCIKAGQLKEIIPLLVRCSAYLRSNSNIDDNRDSWLWHYIMRAEFAIATKRYHRATAVSIMALRASVDRPYQQYYFHMILARIAKSQGNAADAFGHALTARICAIRSQSYSLELEASEFLYSVTLGHPEALESFSQMQEVEGAWSTNFGTRP